MKFSTTLFVATLAASVVAAPAPGKSSSGKTCGNKQTIACCNLTKSPQKIKNGGLFGFFDIVVAPQGCTPIQLLAGLTFSQICGNNVAQCCDNQQTGLININLGQCNAIPI